MKCPVCTTVNLVMSERQGIEIDYCPECRGVWLDRGELDKIIERSSARETDSTPPPPQPAHQPSYAPQQARYGKDHAHDNHRGYGHGHKQYRKKSFLEELFD
jgi:Zn-finger nucleic acid-binding protein